MGMYPDQPQNPYDFILSPQKPPKTSRFGGGSNGKNKGALVITGIAVVIVAFFSFLIFLSTRPDPNINNMIGLTQTQQELHRVALAGATTVTDQGIKNSAVTIELVSLSNQNQTVTYLSTQKKKVPIKILGLKQSKETDSQLAAASENGTYDIVFTQVMQSKLQSYASEVQNAYNGTKGTNARKLLIQEYTDAQNLIKQLKNNTPSSS